MTARGRAVLVAGTALALLVVLAHPAAAESAAEVRALAEQARHDPAALERLRAVDEVDGRPVDLGAALAGSGDRLDRRLQALAGGGDVAPATGARERAARILAGADFTEHHPPRPLRGVLRWLGERLRPVLDPIGRGFDAVVAEGWLSTAIAAATVLATTVAAFVVVHRRGTVMAGDRGGRWRGERRESPDELERRAADAERTGDLDTALRLRFRAGLLRLDAAGALTYRPSLTMGAVRRQVASPALAGLTDAVEEVVYGGRSASAGDVEQARRQWPVVLDEVRR